MPHYDLTQVDFGKGKDTPQALAVDLGYLFHCRSDAGSLWQDNLGTIIIEQQVHYLVGPTKEHTLDKMLSALPPTTIVIFQTRKSIHRLLQPYQTAESQQRYSVQDGRRQ